MSHDTRFCFICREEHAVGDSAPLADVDPGRYPDSGGQAPQRVPGCLSDAISPEVTTAETDEHMFGFMPSTGYVNCMCGWRTECVGTREEARAAWDIHRAAVTSEDLVARWNAEMPAAIEDRVRARRDIAQVRQQRDELAVLLAERHAQLAEARRENGQLHEANELLGAALAEAKAEIAELTTVLTGFADMEATVEYGNRHTEDGPITWHASPIGAWKRTVLYGPVVPVVESETTTKETT